MSDGPDRLRAAHRVRTVPNQLWAILVESWAEARASARRLSLLWGSALVLTLVIYPFEERLLRSLQEGGNDFYRLAEVLSTIGRFENSSLLFAVVLASVGLAFRSPRWKRAAVGCLVAGIVAGLAVTVLRPTLGRARPHAEAPAGFYLLEIDADFHSMPSGHASTNVASAVAIARLLPPLAVPALVYAGGVCWARMQLNRHHPTDILWGFTLGGTLGWTVAGALLGRTGSGRSRSTEPS